jgi:hypothetical protein
MEIKQEVLVEHLNCRNPTLEEWEDDSFTPKMGTREPIGTLKTLEFIFRGQNTSLWNVFFISLESY